MYRHALESLDLSLCPRLGDDNLPPVAILSQLKSLNISKTFVTDAGFARLKQMKLHRLDAEVQSDINLPLRF